MFFARCPRTHRRRAALVVGNLLALTLAAGARTVAAPPRAGGSPATDPVELRIRRIEDGLLPRVLVAGEPVHTATLAERMAELHVPGVSIAVIHDGRIEWARGFGVTKLGGPQVTPETLFQAASISKPVTALAALRLVESGKLDLDADVNQRLDTWKLPASAALAASKVTLRALLSHTAGITVHGFPGYAADEPRPGLLQVLKGEKPANTGPILVDSEPGTAWRYSGGGFVVLQKLLEDSTGRPFPDLMQELVLRPAGMTESSYEQPLSSPRAERAAQPHQQDGTLVRGGPHVYPELAAAGLWTTPSDLARYALEVQASLSGKGHVLSAATAREMLTPVLRNWGLGVSVGGGPAGRYFTHGGSNAGFQCVLAAFAGQGDGAVIMTNSDSGGRLASELLATIAHEYAWPELQPPTRTPVKVAPAVLATYAGRYELLPGFDVTIELDGEQLTLQATGQPKALLFAEGEARFFMKVADVQLDFVREPDGKVNRLVLHQGGADINGTRK